MKCEPTEELGGLYHEASRHSTAWVKLEIRAPTMCLGSLNPAKLCNWTRLIGNGLYNFFVEDKAIADHAARENVFFPIKSIVTWDYLFCGPGSVVGTAKAYELDGPGIESRWRRDFPHLSRPALGSAQPQVQWVPDLSQG